MAPTRIDRVLGFEHGLPPVIGLAAVILGLAFLFLGWRTHRLTLTISGFLLGAFIGQLVAHWAQVERAWGVFVGGTAIALLADPLSRVMVFVLAGLAMGIGLGEGVRVLVAPRGFVYGFIPGFLAGGALSLWKLRHVLILTTAFLGSALACWGAVVLLCRVDEAVGTMHVRHPVLFLSVLGLAFVAGSITQFMTTRDRDPAEER
jgi:hypothetical protein